MSVNGRSGRLGGLLGASWAVIWGEGLTPVRSPFAPPSALPLKGFAHTRTSSLVPRSFRYLGRHGNGKSASGTCPRWLMAPFALGNLGVESLLRHRSLLGALVFRDVYVAARSWEPWCRELFT